MCPRFVLLLVAVLACPLPLRAQSTLVVEARGGITQPVGTRPATWAAGEGGAAAGIRFALQRGPHSAVYLGFSQLRTPCQGEGCGGTRVNTQWEGGLRFDLRTAGVVPWLQLGGVSPSLERVPLATPGAPPTYGLSERGWGGEVGGGLRLPIGDRLALSPGARYVVARVGDHGPEPVTVRWMVLDIGLAVGF